jgi:hypothetical protein
MPLNSQEPQHTWLNSEHNDCCSCGWRCAFNGSGTHFVSRCEQAHARHVERETEALCEDCGHEVRLHGDKYGCQYERGDSLVGGHNKYGEEVDAIPMAMGPCGCTAITVEKDTPEQKAADLLAEFQEHESEQAQTFDEFMQEEPGHAL